MEKCLQRTTIQLQEWLHRMAHQKRVSDIIHITFPAGQLTLQRAYETKGYSTHRKRDYPP